VPLVLHHATGMIRGHWRRIASAAFVFFVPTASLHIAAQLVHDDYAHTGGWPRYFLLTGFLLAVTFIRFLGEVVFSGFLDMAVGDSYFRDEERSLMHVIRDLPWVPLVIVDFAVVTAAVIGLALFVIPGILVYTFWGLAGPVVVQERRRARDSLRRTYQISRPYWRLVILLVVIPLGLEHALANTVRDFVDQWGNVAIVAGEWFIAATMLGIIGVIDVALANELMARVPAITTAAEAG
jgi:hypothetical protein